MPPYLAIVTVIEHQTNLFLLLFPPLAAIGYALFLQPYHPRARFRGVVLGPVAGALLGVAALAWVPTGGWRTLVVTAAGIIVLALLDIQLAPALALTLLIPLLDARGLEPVGAIALSSLGMWLLFLLWRGVVYARAYPPPPGTPPLRPWHWL